MELRLLTGLFVGDEEAGDFLIEEGGNNRFAGKDCPLSEEPIALPTNPSPTRPFGRRGEARLGIRSKSQEPSMIASFRQQKDASVG
jgi:hypothetical protein